MKSAGISPYEALGNAVVLQAVKDYSRAYKRLLRHPNDHLAKRDVAEIEKFFTSAYFNIFTDLEGEMLMHRLQDEMEENS